MIRKKKKLTFRKKIAIYKEIKRKGFHYTVDNGLSSIKCTIQFHEKIPKKVKNDLLMVISIMEEPVKVIMSLFEDKES